MRKKVIVIALLVGFVYLLHSTPHLALRTYVFVTGHPVAAVTTGIVENEYINQVDHDKMDEKNAKAYTLTKPPIEKATQGELRNYLVKKVGFIHLVEFYGET